MPFILRLKKPLQNEKKANAILNHRLQFDESEFLMKMIARLRRTKGCDIVEVVKVEAEQKQIAIILGE